MKVLTKIILPSHASGFCKIYTFMFTYNCSGLNKHITGAVKIQVVAR